MYDYMVLFFTHSGAMKFKRKSKKDSFPCELMPVPRQLSSNCGVSARITYDGVIDTLVDDEIEKIYRIEKDEYTLIYSEDGTS